MAIQHLAVSIAIWVLVAVLLVVVVIIGLIMWRRRNQARAADALYPGQKHFTGYDRSMTPDLSTNPCPGVYTAPCSVQLIRPVNNMGYCAVHVDVGYVDSRTTTALEMDHNGQRGASAVVLGTDDFYSDDYLLYTSPLEFAMPGTYTIRAHTVYPSEHVVGVVQQFTFVIQDSPAAAPGGIVSQSNRNHDIDINLQRAAIAVNNNNNLNSAQPLVLHQPSAAAAFPDKRPLAPRITPSRGTVTTRTQVIIAPNEYSTTADQIRYSVDGSYPYLLYSGPFKLSVPPPTSTSSSLGVTVRAIAVSSAGGHAGAMGPVSDVSEATLHVRPSGLSYLDTNIPAPTMRLRARNASLYFDESKNPAGTRTCYQLQYINEARLKVKFNHKKCTVYAHQPIPLSENVAKVFAWTVDEQRLRHLQRETRDGLVMSDDDELHTAASATRLRSVATVYNCERASTEQTKPSRRRTGGDEAGSSLLLPAPVVCVSCDEMEVEFDDPPANSILAYTLNGKEPALYDVAPPACALELDGDRRHGGHHGRQRSGSRKSAKDNNNNNIVGDEGGIGTFRYQPSQVVRVTLLETEGTFVTARIFMPIFETDEGQVCGAAGGQGGSNGVLLGYRYGEVFRRGFFFHDT